MTELGTMPPIRIPGRERPVLGRVGSILVELAPVDPSFAEHQRTVVLAPPDAWPNRDGKRVKIIFNNSGVVWIVSESTQGNPKVLATGEAGFDPKTRSKIAILRAQNGDISIYSHSVDVGLPAKLRVWRPVLSVWGVFIEDTNLVIDSAEDVEVRKDSGLPALDYVYFDKPEKALEPVAPKPAASEHPVRIVLTRTRTIKAILESGNCSRTCPNLQEFMGCELFGELESTCRRHPDCIAEFGSAAFDFSK